MAPWPPPLDPPMVTTQHMWRREDKGMKMISYHRLKITKASVNIINGVCVKQLLCWVEGYEEKSERECPYFKFMILQTFAFDSLSRLSKYCHCYNMNTYINDSCQAQSQDQLNWGLRWLYFHLTLPPDHLENFFLTQSTKTYKRKLVTLY